MFHFTGVCLVDTFYETFLCLSFRRIALSRAPFSSDIATCLCLLLVQEIAILEFLDQPHLFSQHLACQRRAMRRMSQGDEQRRMMATKSKRRRRHITREGSLHDVGHRPPEHSTILMTANHLMPYRGRSSGVLLILVSSYQHSIKYAPRYPSSLVVPAVLHWKNSVLRQDSALQHLCP